MKVFNQLLIKKALLIAIMMVILSISLYSQEHDGYKLQNPITTEYLKINLRKKSPRLVLDGENEKVLFLLARH